MPSAPIYLDNAASTRIADEVIALMTEVMRTAWGNPTRCTHRASLRAATRGRAHSGSLAALGGTATSCGRRAAPKRTRSRCSAPRARTPARSSISTFEHAAVATLADRLAAEGREVVRVAPARPACSMPRRSLAPHEDAGVVSLIAVQNEIGLVQPLAELVAAIRARAPQRAHPRRRGAGVRQDRAVGECAQRVDSIAIAGHKLHGPKGVGALWLRSGA